MNVRSLLTALLASVALVSCHTETVEPIVSGTKMIVHASQQQTRTAIAGKRATWLSTDEIALFKEGGAQNVKFTLLSGAGTSAASFEGEMSFAAGNYYAAYPYLSSNTSASAYRHTIAAVQTQDGATDAASLGRYALMVASPVAATAVSDMNITFSQMMTIMDFSLTNLPEGETVESVTLSAADAVVTPFATAASCDITSSSPALSCTDKVNALKLNISNAPSQAFVASLVMFPVDFSSAAVDLVITVETDKNTYTIDKPAVNTCFDPGWRYNTNINLATAKRDPSSVATSNLVAYFPMDGAGTETIAAIEPTATGATFVAGLRGECYQGADGAAMIYTMPENHKVTQLKAYALSMWLKQAAIPAEQAPVPMLFQLVADSDLFWGNMSVSLDRLGTEASPSTMLNMKITFRKDGVDWANQSIIYSNPAFSADNWFHIIYQYDNVTSAFNIYVNGVKVTTDAGLINRFQSEGGPALGDLIPIAGNRIVIGGWMPKLVNNATDEWMGYFKGSMDEVRLYDRALTDTEAKALYDAEISQLD